MFDLSGLDGVAFGVCLFGGPLTMLEGFIYSILLACSNLMIVFFLFFINLLATVF